MLALSKKSMLALEAVLDVAYNARPDPVQSKDITERQGVQQRYLEQVLQQLVRAGILKGVRGPRGGYTLARERRRISLGDVLRVIEEMDTDDNLSVSQSALGSVILNPIRETAYQNLLASFDKLSMEDLCNRAQQAGISRAGDDTASFDI